MKKIAIIGASGLLARPVIQQLEDEGFQLRLFSRSINPSMFDKNYEMVRGDVLDPSDLRKALEGCDAVHISLSKVDEALATKMIVEEAARQGIQLISMVSGCTVAEQNRWFNMIENKFQAEQTLIHSGIPYMIFRPTWFFETLDLMVREGKAVIPGNQPHPSHWVAAGDFARMVAAAYGNPEARNRIFFIHGPQEFRMKEIMEKYCEVRHPEIEKVNTIPIGLMRFIGAVSRKKELLIVAAMFSYFNKVKEMGDPGEANRLLGKPETTFDKWVNSRN